MLLSISASGAVKLVNCSVHLFASDRLHLYRFGTEDKWREGISRIIRTRDFDLLNPKIPGFFTGPRPFNCYEQLHEQINVNVREKNLKKFLVSSDRNKHCSPFHDFSEKLI